MAARRHSPRTFAVALATAGMVLGVGLIAAPPAAAMDLPIAVESVGSFVHVIDVVISSVTESLVVFAPTALIPAALLLVLSATSRKYVCRKNKWGLHFSPPYLLRAVAKVTTAT